MSTSSDPTVFEMLESVLLLITGVAVGAAMLPGFTLCIPILAPLAIVVVVPLVLVGVLVALTAVILAIPYLLIRSLAGIRSRRAARGPMSVRVPVAGT